MQQCPLSSRAAASRTPLPAWSAPGRPILHAGGWSVPGQWWQPDLVDMAVRLDYESRLATCTGSAIDVGAGYQGAVPVGGDPPPVVLRPVFGPAGCNRSRLSAVP